ncbi:MAG: hypothetical protein RIM72_00595 [Alphaproteobacteria bacterium]
MAYPADRPQSEMRTLIEADQVIARLQDHVLGKAELTNTQVTAALGLLKKTLPDLPSSLAVLTDRHLSHDELLDELE